MATRHPLFTSQNAVTWLRTSMLCLQSACCILPLAVPAAAQSPTDVITEVRLEQEGRPVDDPSIAGLIQTKPGEPLTMSDVRESIAHLSSLNKFDDVQVYREDVAGGVRVRFVLVPSHPVDRVEFTGMLGLPRGDLDRIVRDRFGPTPRARRADDVAALLKDTYRSRGYPDAVVRSRIEESHEPDRASLVFEIQSGPRVPIANVTVEQLDRTPADVLVGAPNVRVGQPYDAERIDRELARYGREMRERGYLEARATHTAEFTPRGADVRLQVSRGPRVTIAFTGDEIPASERERLVPIRTEASVSQDLLEDAQNAMVGYLHARGYRDARVEYTPREQNNELTLTFDVQRGPRYTVDAITVEGSTAIPSVDVVKALRLEAGEPFVQSALDSGSAVVRNMYRNLGFTRAEVRPVVTVLPDAGSGDVERRVRVVVGVTEGPRAIVRAVTIRGNAAIPEVELRRLLTSVPGRPYSEVDLVADRDRIELEYRNRGYENAVVNPAAMLSEGDTRADVAIAINEGLQILVDHIIITGNERTNPDIIRRELVLEPGDPMGSAAMIESQQRLSALGLFRRVRLTEIQHGGDPRRDLLIEVEEAPPNTHAYGAGLEVGSRLRTSDQGTAEERFEFVPRGSFEIGRRNMWGKNRSINFFTRVSLRSRDLVLADGGLSLEKPESRLGFNEYRVFTTYREPRIFNTRADLLVTGLVDQAIRSSFNFNRRQGQAEVGLRLNPRYSVAGRYSFERTELFDEVFTEDEKPLIDRLFPQVRLSKFSGTLIRDSRQDLLDPAGGSLVSVTSDVALRAIGSEVGFVKAYIETYAYPQLPIGRRTVLALGGRLGLAHGLAREFENELVEDIPASERFFAGGDTTVRGFSLDRLGSHGTITSSGFPTGGNAVAIVNAELRFGLPWSLQAVTFVDAGNVFTRLSQLDLTDLRPALGVGARVKLPLLTAPIRVDVGFNVHPRELVPGREERRAVLHVSLGQAF